MVQRRRILVAAAGLMAVLVAVYLAVVLAAGDGVRPGTVVEGVAIGGLTQAEAEAKLEATLGKAARKPIKVTAGSKDFVVKPKDAGLRFDAAATVAAASGRTLNPVALMSDLFGQRQVDPVLVVDEGALASQVEGMAVAVDRPATEPVITVKGKNAKLTAGKAGRGLDQDATRAAIVGALLQPRGAITATIAKVLPVVSSDSARQSFERAKAAVASPVFVTTEAGRARIRPAAIGRALSFTTVDGTLEPQLDGAVLHKSMAGKLAKAERPGRDATFVIKNGKPVVVPSVIGQGVANDELAAGVLSVIDKQPPDRTVALTLGVREPEVTTEQARALGITEQLSTFTQNFPFAPYRVQNIGQAARNVNGTLLLPGQTFSMNDAMKERTEKNGYTVGFVVGPGGVFAEDLGGGVSTATTTVWTGAFYAGMERVFTQAHSIYISRYKPGLEATVAWGLFDMKFKNDNPTGVFITTRMTNTSMSVTFWGTRIYSDIKAEFGPKRDVRPYSTIYDTGESCLGQGGMDGFTIDVDRVFYKGAKEVKRQTITTNYKPAPEVVCGKKPKPGEATGSSRPGATASASASAKPSTAKPSPTKSPTAKAPAAESAPIPGTSTPAEPTRKPKPSPSPSR